MKIKKVRIKNYRSIQDSEDIIFSDNLFVLAGQNESGKSSILEALDAYENGKASKDTLNFSMENDENFIQEISCTYSELDDSFFEDVVKQISLLKTIGTDSERDKEIMDILDYPLLKQITEFTITQIIDYSGSEPVIKKIFDKNTVEKVKKSIKVIVEDAKEGDANKQIKKPSIDIDSNHNKLLNAFDSNKPKIILFNDFTTLLPDKVLLSEIDDKSKAGYQAVKNLESLLRKDFRTIAQKESRQRKTAADVESKEISVGFQSDWQQKIYGNNEVKILFHIENNKQGIEEIIFSVATKESEPLAPRKRSKGMIWFLSLWLELKAKENHNKLVLLFDEPGLHLHIKANKDMLNVFHKLVAKGHQIIYSTHSPSLIETDKLHNIGLVINTEEKGTLVEGLTTSKINSENKKDALYPIAEAMGLEPLKDFSVLKQKNVLLEGISDFWYIKGFAHLLNKKSDYEFIPGVGIKGTKMNTLISFCIGYGLEWVLVMDSGDLPKSLRKELKEGLFQDDEVETNSKVLLTDADEIENMLTVKDLILIDSTIKESAKKPIEIIGKGRKVVFAKLFFQKAINNEIKSKDLHPNTIKNFEKLFSWIDDKFKTQ